MPELRIKLFFYCVDQTIDLCQSLFELNQMRLKCGDRALVQTLDLGHQT